MKTKELNISNLITLNVAAVFSLSSIAYMATIGMQSVIFFAVAACAFFIPSALVAAELGGMFTKNDGGVFIWVKSAFGNNVGLIAIWMEWFNNVISFPGTLLSIAATISFYFFSNLMSNKLLLIISILIIFWALTFFNFLQIKKITILYNIGAILGVIVSASILIIGGFQYSIINYTNLHLTDLKTWSLDLFSISTLSLFVKTLGSYSGIQAVAFYVRNISSPQKNIPKSIAYSVIIIFSLSTLATVSLVTMIPPSDINPLNGMIQGISIILQKWHLSVLTPYLTAFIVTGMIASLSAWVLGPARSMQEVAYEGFLPQIFTKTNKHKMPVNILIVQAIITTILTVSSLSMPNIYQAFAMILAITSQFTVILWIMIFLSAIKLRFSANHLHRHFTAGNNIILCIVSTIGCIACLIGFCLGFIPPKFAHTNSIISYAIRILIVNICIIVIPFIYIFYKNKSVLWDRKHH